MVSRLERGVEVRGKNNPWEDIKDPKDFLAFLNGYMGGLITKNGKEKVMGVIPHIIMAHGFFSWQRILIENGASRTDMKKTKKERDKIEKSLFVSFSQELFSQPSFSVFTPGERSKLNKEGWQTYLED